MPEQVPAWIKSAARELACRQVSARMTKSGEPGILEQAQAMAQQLHGKWQQHVAAPAGLSQRGSNSALGALLGAAGGGLAGVGINAATAKQKRPGRSFLTGALLGGTLGGAGGALMGDSSGVAPPGGAAPPSTAAINALLGREGTAPVTPTETPFLEGAGDLIGNAGRGWNDSLRGRYGYGAAGLTAVGTLDAAGGAVQRIRRLRDGPNEPWRRAMATLPDIERNPIQAEVLRNVRGGLIDAPASGGNAALRSFANLNPAEQVALREIEGLAGRAHPWYMRSPVAGTPMPRFGGRLSAYGAPAALSAFELLHRLTRQQNQQP